MTNTIIPQNISASDAVYAAKISKQAARSDFNAPDKLPKYSIYNAVEAQDKFLCTLKKERRKIEKSKKQIGIIKKAAAAVIAAGVFFVLEAKKII